MPNVFRSQGEVLPRCARLKSGRPDMLRFVLINPLLSEVPHFFRARSLSSTAFLLYTEVREIYHVDLTSDRSEESNMLHDVAIFAFGKPGEVVKMLKKCKQL